MSKPVSLKDKLKRGLNLEQNVEHHDGVEQHDGVELEDDPKDEDIGLDGPKDIKHNQIFHLFKLPLNEKYVTRFRCSYEKIVSHPGTIYLTTTKLLFYSKFPTEEMIRIDLVNITTLQKKKTAGILPNAVKITTRERGEYQFGNFVRRDHALNTIEKQIKTAEEVVAKRKEEERVKTFEKAAIDGILVNHMNIFSKGEAITAEITEDIEGETLRSGQCCCIIL